MPFIVGEVTVKNGTHLAELSKSLNYFNLSEAEIIQGFDPEGIFSRYLTIVRYKNLVTTFVEES